MTVVVKQGELQVIQTGSVLISNNSPTTIILDNSYTIVIKYKDDAKDTQQNMSAEANERGITIELKNFNNPLGTTTTAPIPIAAQGNLTIYISLSVITIGVAKVLTYGLYSGTKGESDSGK